LALLKLRDRDAIVTDEGLIFRVFGYTHPRDSYVCDIEYAPATVFKSDDPRAFRSDGKRVFYKFYKDEGWDFLKAGYPQYLILHEMLPGKVIGVTQDKVATVRKPNDELWKIVVRKPRDKLVAAMQNCLKLVTQRSGLLVSDFGVFGSMLHGFHHPEFSDIDFVIYGRRQFAKLHEALQELYATGSSFRNEFETDQSIRGKCWLFRNFSPREYVWHQRRKMIYALFSDGENGRVIKTEFEPAKGWKEIRNEYDSGTRLLRKGWVRMTARVTGDDDAPFIPSVYGIEPLEVFEGAREALEAKRIVSYLEEFRIQAFNDEIVRVEGNLEEVVTPDGSFFQIALTYCPRYYKQVLKSTNCNSVS
jgi:predicted nucleotidyltransferase